MANGFDYVALWSVARDALDAVNGLTSAICNLPMRPIAPWAKRNRAPDAHERWQAALKALPERRAKAAEAIRKAAETLGELLAEDRFIAPVAGVWPASAPEIARRLSSGLGMAASAARAVSEWKDDAPLDQPKRFVVDAQYAIQAVVGELERRPDVAALACQRQVEKLRVARPDWSADEALASWQNGDGGDNGNLIERLLAGPDDVELTPRELALLKAYLKQPVSLSTIQQETRAAGQSETLAKRNKLTLIRDFNRNLQAAQLTGESTRSAVNDKANNRTADAAEATDAPQPVTKPKRSTERGEARAKLIAALTKHHQYADGSCLNQAPIGNNELARLAEVSESTASTFFTQEFGEHAKYRASCRDTTRLVASLKLLNQEFSPHHLFGGTPSGERERDDEE